MNDTPSTLVAVATYNEIENLPQLVDEIFHYLPQAKLLVVDDGSPDGTGRWCDEHAANEPRLHVIHRPGKMGLGTATIEAMSFAIREGFEVLLTLDADFSHAPRHLPELLAGVVGDDASRVDVMIGSRYVAGGGIEGWTLRRHVMSRMVNAYARWLLWLPTRDCSGAFRCYRVSVLQRLDLQAVRSRGYSFYEEILWRLKQVGARFGETPIVFVDRKKGQSKINLREAWLALWTILWLGVARPQSTPRDSV
jgi:dolichol-phosphate mannosyltransferase